MYSFLLRRKIFTLHFPHILLLDSKSFTQNQKNPKVFTSNTMHLHRKCWNSFIMGLLLLLGNNLVKINTWVTLNPPFMVCKRYVTNYLLKFSPQHLFLNFYILFSFQKRCLSAALVKQKLLNQTFLTEACYVFHSFFHKQLLISILQSHSLFLLCFNNCNHLTLINWMLSSYNRSANYPDH